MRIDVALLREQIAFLDNYPWRDGMPEEVIGIVNLLDAILDEEEEEEEE